MLEPDENGVLMEIAAAPARRIAAVSAVYAAGGLLVWLGANAGSLGGVVVIAIGVVGLVTGEALRRASRVPLCLTVDGLFDGRGTRLAAWEEIRTVERGSFALKPSNGFALDLHTPGGRAWLPGIWWRIGRRVGVGGVLPARPTRFMGEQIALRLESGG